MTEETQLITKHERFSNPLDLIEHLQGQVRYLTEREHELLTEANDRIRRMAAYKDAAEKLSRINEELYEKLKSTKIQYSNQVVANEELVDINRELGEIIEYVNSRRKKSDKKVKKLKRQLKGGK